MASVGANLKRLREASGLTQHALAKKAGISQQLISRLEAGKNVKTIALASLSKALDVTADRIDEDFKCTISKHDEVIEIFSKLPASKQALAISMLRRMIQMDEIDIR
jgi:transcriptional regulator with XRE-family HTH domain